jgi:AraC-like DNA-binding protein/CheY-like chemotaxis protein
MDDHRAERFALVTAGHRFILKALAFDDSNFRTALSEFVAAGSSSRLPTADLESVLLQTLVVLNDHTGGRRPTLVERYLAERHSGLAPLARFHEIVKDALRFRAARDPLVQRATATIEKEYASPGLTAKILAQSIGCRQEVMSASFFAELGLYPSDYLRQVRLDRAAALLATTNETVKEIWVAVGYNHASNFDHDFKKRFGVAPREYRARMTEDPAAAAKARAPSSSEERCKPIRAPQKGTVLIVDDDRGTRETIAGYLTLEGYAIGVAESGEDGLREAQRAKPVAVLLDYHLPDIDGLECLRRLRRQSVRAAVIVFTADWEIESHADEFRRLGATFLSKLCDLDEIQSTIAGQLSSSTSRSGSML